MKLIKYLYHVLMKKTVLDDGIHTLAYFHKDCNKNVIRIKIKMKMKIIIIMIIKNDNDNDNDNEE